MGGTLLNGNKVGASSYKLGTVYTRAPQATVVQRRGRTSTPEARGDPLLSEKNGRGS